MGMGKRKRSKQDSLFIPTASLARSSSHDFYERLNQVLSADGFDDFVEDLCEPFYLRLTESTPDHIFSPQLIVSQRINQWDNFRYPQKYPQGMGGGVSLSSVL